MARDVPRLSSKFQVPCSYISGQLDASVFDFKCLIDIFPRRLERVSVQQSHSIPQLSDDRRLALVFCTSRRRDYAKAQSCIERTFENGKDAVY